MQKCTPLFKIAIIKFVVQIFADNYTAVAPIDLPVINDVLFLLHNMFTLVVFLILYVYMRVTFYQLDVIAKHLFLNLYLFKNILAIDGLLLFSSALKGIF